MTRSLAPALCLGAALLAAPSLAQDERPPYQMLEGIEACLLGVGAVPATGDSLAKFGWTAQADESEMGTVGFVPGIGTDTFVYMSDAGEFCHVESMVMGTDEAAGMLELFLAEQAITVVGTEKGELTCPVQILSNGVAVEITSAGNDPTCTDANTSGLRFVFPTGG
jgi:hypothetical protein